MVQCWKIFLETLTILHHDTKMITSETPYKLAEIIRNTWPGLYTPAKQRTDIKKDKEKWQN